ncbi:hypothetical protein GGR95_002940 [Sulfitobacter undariae]|uniref:Uncharacterized protein n=1 Tax=Sulfitobacter undariae TaxID=1563671 RepID=A0A7W6H175_9RHOB|nr:hypothetical protein [Sulfitobacter undariae]MBB3995285.1 hypothetical protein [Sulfitobacter undariae]
MIALLQSLSGTSLGLLFVLSVAVFGLRAVWSLGGIVAGWVS